MNAAAPILRDALPSDATATRDVVTRAFETEGEALLVDDLVRDGDAQIALVAELEGAIVGHVMLSRMQAPFPALALAPVSVMPGEQGAGVGSRLVRRGIEAAREAGWAAIFVLGAPAYYGRFGFQASLAEGFASPYVGPSFMALALDPPLSPLEGVLKHAPAFEALERRAAGPDADDAHGG